MYARGNDGLRRKRRRSGMNIRETMEQWERQNLSPYASLSSETLGRDPGGTALRYPPCLSA